MCDAMELVSLLQPAVQRVLLNMGLLVARRRCRRRGCQACLITSARRRCRCRGCQACLITSTALTHAPLVRPFMHPGIDDGRQVVHTLDFQVSCHLIGAAVHGECGEGGDQCLGFHQGLHEVLTLRLHSIFAPGVCLGAILQDMFRCTAPWGATNATGSGSPRNPACQVSAHT